MVDLGFIPTVLGLLILFKTIDRLISVISFFLGNEKTRQCSKMLIMVSGEICKYFAKETSNSTAVTRVIDHCLVFSRHDSSVEFVSGTYWS